MAQKSSLFTNLGNNSVCPCHGDAGLVVIEGEPGGDVNPAAQRGVHSGRDQEDGDPERRTSCWHRCDDGHNPSVGGGS